MNICEKMLRQELTTYCIVKWHDVRTNEMGYRGEYAEYVRLR